MPGRCLVQRQRLHAELRLRLQVEGVHVEDAGPRAVRRRALVEGAGRRLRAERLDLADLVVGLREHREELRQRRVDAHLEVAIALQQVRALREVELRIGLEVREERLAGRPRSRPACARRPSRRGCARPRRGRPGGSAPASCRSSCAPARGTHTRPCRPAARVHADRRARLRQVLVTHVVAHPPVGGHDLVVDRRRVRGGQPLPIRDRHRVRELR